MGNRQTMAAKRMAMVTSALGLAVAGCLLVAPTATAKTCNGTSKPCSIGDTGPGGGVVFYDAGSKKGWGRYLEAAKPGWSGESADPGVAWCPSGAAYATELPTKNAIGTGRKNTATIIKACGPETAAGKAASYNGGGKSDWFLAAKDELNQLHKQARKVGGFITDSYWSSSQAMDVSACSQFIGSGDGYQDCGNEKSNAYYVRPIRAF